MEERPLNSQTPPEAQGIAITASTVQAQPSPSVQQVVGKITATNTPAKVRKNYFKAWAWRLTATYFWVHAAITVAAGRDVLAGSESAITAKAVMLLSYLGFAPVNAGHLPLVAVMIWLLSIAAFSPVQLLLGLPLYIAIFPFTVVFNLLFRKALKEAEANPVVAVAAPTTSEGSFPVISCSAAMLAAWFLLYGGSSSWGPNLIGFVLSGALFLTLAYEGLGRTSPVEEQDLGFFARVSTWGIQVITSAVKKATDKDKPLTKAENQQRITSQRLQDTTYPTSHGLSFPSQRKGTRCNAHSS